MKTLMNPKVSQIGKYKTYKRVYILKNNPMK